MYYGERFNSITHILGASLATTGGILLVALAWRVRDVWEIASCSVYAATLVLCIWCPACITVREAQPKKSCARWTIAPSICS
jgi:predicted membrane channel-forming protein YqfA (hemolysin III family)